MFRDQNTIGGLNLCMNSCFQVGIDVVIVGSLCTTKEKVFAAHACSNKGMQLIWQFTVLDISVW